jgi:hypothetical protein
MNRRATGSRNRLDWLMPGGGYHFACKRLLALRSFHQSAFIGIVLAIWIAIMISMLTVVGCGPLASAPLAPTKVPPSPSSPKAEITSPKPSPTATAPPETSSAAPPTPTPPQPMTATSSMTKIGATLSMLQVMRQTQTYSNEVAEIVETETVSVNIQFTHTLDEPAIQAIEDSGVIFHRVDDAVSHVGTIYSADVPWEAIALLADRQDVVRIESAWKPGAIPPAMSSP